MAGGGAGAAGRTAAVRAGVAARRPGEPAGRPGDGRHRRHPGAAAARPGVPPAGLLPPGRRRAARAAAAGRGGDRAGRRGHVRAPAPPDPDAGVRHRQPRRLTLAGFALLVPEGLAGVVQYLVADGLVKGTLFVSIGLVQHHLRDIRELELYGRGRNLPWAAALMAAGALGWPGCRRSAPSAVRRSSRRRPRPPATRGCPCCSWWWRRSPRRRCCARRCGCSWASACPGWTRCGAGSGPRRTRTSLDPGRPGGAAAGRRGGAGAGAGAGRPGGGRRRAVHRPARPRGGGPPRRVREAAGAAGHAPGSLAVPAALAVLSALLGAALALAAL